MSKIIEKRVLFPEALRQLCIENDWCTHMTNEQYYKLFKACDEVEAGNQWEITTKDLQSMAEQIIEYSDEDSIDCLLLTDVMSIISHRCLSFFEEVDV